MYALHSRTLYDINYRRIVDQHVSNRQPHWTTSSLKQNQHQHQHQTLRKCVSVIIDWERCVATSSSTPPPPPSPPVISHVSVALLSCSCETHLLRTQRLVRIWIRRFRWQIGDDIAAATSGGLKIVVGLVCASLVVLVCFCCVFKSIIASFGFGFNCVHLRR